MPSVVLDRPRVTPEELHAATGWELKPEGACHGAQCVPLPGLQTGADGTIDVGEFAALMNMPVAVDDTYGLWALGPPSGGRVLTDTRLPELVLSDFDGHPFDVGSLRGRKMLLLAWASW
jgi:hypothetical protein